MFKIKYKILLLLMLLAFAGNDAWAGGGGGTDYWYYSNAKVETVPTGAGKVYAGKQNEAANPNNCVDAPHVFDGKSHKSQFPYNWYLNTIPTDSKKYKFLRWEDGNGNVISTDQNPQNSFKDNEGVKGGGNNTGESGDGATNPGTITVNYIAIYEEIINQYVSVESQNPQYLTATIDKPENEIGDEVTLWAYPNNYNSKFTGWSKDGEIVSMENPWTFTIDADNAGTYIATYKTGYNFYRFRNKGTSRRFNAISDQGSITNFSSLQLVNGDVATYSAGSVIQISMHHISGGDVYDYIMQNSHTSAYYNESNGEYITMSLNSVDNTWTINPNRQAAYMADEGGSNVTAYGVIKDDIAHWYIDPIDKDLETKENYFSLDPNKLIEVDGKYYTTLRTSWNILFNPEQMTPYIVKSVDETEGTFEMEPISGNIIPAGTPVIIETSSNEVLDNRMVPTTTAAASGAVPSGNLLQTSTKYFPNQSVSTSNNYKNLTVNSSGQLAFGGNALNSVNGNEAYLCVANDVIKIPIWSLADIEQSGEKNKLYTIADELIAVEYRQVGEGNDVYLWCKDQGNVSINKTEIKEGQVDFMKQQGQQVGEWDQSNWVVLKLTGNTAISVANGAKNHYIDAASVTGLYVDDVNYMIEVTNNQLSVGGTAEYTPNVYSPANFMLSNLNIRDGQGGQTFGDNDTYYFFMNPKIQEVCKITFAEWKAPVNDNPGYFTVPYTSGFDGAFNIGGWQYNEYNDVSDDLVDESSYFFNAVVNRANINAYGPKAVEIDHNTNPDGALIVYPADLKATNNVPTAINNMQQGKTVVRVVYYNMMGVENDRPFPGVNIIVKEMSDGSKVATKAIIK